MWLISTNYFELAPGQKFILEFQPFLAHQFLDFRKPRFESQIFIFGRNFQHNGCEEQEAGEREREDIWRMKWLKQTVFSLSFFTNANTAMQNSALFSVLLYWNSIFLAITIGSNLVKRTPLLQILPERLLWRCHL